MFRVLSFRLAALACAASIAGLQPAHAEAPPEAIAEIIGEAAQVCRAKGGTPDTTAILRGDDLNGDSGADWIADFARLKCSGADNPACNANGCMLQLYFWNGDGWDLVFEDFVKGYKFSSSGDTRTMHVTTSGAACNRSETETCTYNYLLEKDALRPVQ